MILGILIGAFLIGGKYYYKIREAEKLSDKHLEMFLLMYFWVRNLQEGKEIHTFLKEKGYKNISIYGLNYIGKCLWEELNNGNIQINNVIDKNKHVKYKNVVVKSPDDEIEKTDLIIVTALYFFEEVKRELEVKVDCPIISLEDIVYKM